MKSEDIEERLFQEIIHCQEVMQYLDSLYSPENHHILDLAKNYFNDLYVIKIDYLTAKIMRFFDPEKSAGKDNFSIRKIQLLIPNLQLIDYSKDETIIKLRQYRHKYLSHNDFEGSRNSFPSYMDLKKDLGKIISYLFDVLDKVRDHNGKQDTELCRKAPRNSYAHYYDILNLGAFVASNRREKEFSDILQKSRRWHNEKRNEKLNEQAA